METKPVVTLCSQAAIIWGLISFLGSMRREDGLKEKGKGRGRGKKNPSKKPQGLTFVKPLTLQSKQLAILKQVTL